MTMSRLTTIQLVLGSILSLCSIASAHAGSNYETLHTFTGAPDGRGGYAELVPGPDGLLYGTTTYGGTGIGCGTYGCGTVFRMSRMGEVKVLHSFERVTDDGAQPRAAMLLGADGNFYGTTSSGGAFGYGILYRMTPKGKFTQLHSFDFEAKEGIRPASRLVQTPDGALWGTTVDGGAGEGPYCVSAGGAGCGTVFRYLESEGLTTVHSFSGELTDGAFPQAGLLLASDGYLYGTTHDGGKTNQGTVFRVSQRGVTKVMHHFDGLHGQAPSAALIQASDGRLYGTTFYGGDDSCGAGCGIVFSLGLDRSFRVEHRFKHGDGGSAPLGRLLEGPDGRLYGTAFGDGDRTHCFFGCGTVFSLTPGEHAKTLYVFAGGTQDGAAPAAGLTWLDDRHLVSVASEGGSADFGTVFQLKVK